MQLFREPQQVTFRLHMAEASLLLHSFQELLKDYASPPEDLDPKVQEAWYQRKNRRSSGLTGEEVSVWVDEQHQHKVGLAAKIRHWIDELAKIQGEEVVFSLPLSEVDSWLVILNDFRLKRAAEFDISEEDMESPLSESKHPDKHLAVIEIGFLGMIIGALIEALELPPPQET